MTAVSVDPVASPAVDVFIHRSSALQPCDAPASGPAFLRTSASSPGAPSSWLLHEQRLRLISNDVQAPAADVVPQVEQCPTVPRTFLNEHTCVVGRQKCTEAVYDSTPMVLNDEGILAFFGTSARHVHYITGLRVEDERPPCSIPTSRWMRLGGESDCGDAAEPSEGSNAEIDETTHAWLSALLIEADDGADVVDVLSQDKAQCTTADRGVTILVSKNSTDGSGGVTRTCWRHVHSDEYSVYDFTAWTALHSGNYKAHAGRRPNPITAFALRGSAALEFPAWHTPNRWKDKKSRHVYIGRRNQPIDFATLPRVVRTAEMAEWADAGDATGLMKGAVAESCGSPGEVANDPALGNMYNMAIATADDLRIQKLD